MKLKGMVREDDKGSVLKNLFRETATSAKGDYLPPNPSVKSFRFISSQIFYL